MNQVQIVEWLQGVADQEGYDVGELFNVYIAAREERKRETGSLKHLLWQDYALYERLMQERTEYGYKAVKAYIAKGKEVKNDSNSRGSGINTKLSPDHTSDA